MECSMKNRGSQKESTEEGYITSYGASKAGLHSINALNRGQERLKELQQEISVAQLAGGLADHFNNILTVVIGYGSLLQVKMGEDDPLKVYVDRIMSSSERAVQLTGKLHVFSDRLKVRQKPMDLNETVRRAERLFPRYVDDGVEVTTDLSGISLPVFADPSRLEETIVNLITNANDSMPFGGKLVLSTKQLRFENGFPHHNGENGSACALLSVRDSGTGMDKKVKEHIFEPFFTTKETGKGIGLGLSIVYQTVKLHNGVIKVDSTPQEGTVVNIYLPLLRTRLNDFDPVPCRSARDA